MSWSFNAIGKPAAVAVKARKDLSAVKCSEPEESLKESVIASIELACSAMPDDPAVSITASGSQSPSYKLEGGHYREVAGKLTNSLKLDIEPIYGFVE